MRRNQLAIPAFVAACMAMLLLILAVLGTVGVPGTGRGAFILFLTGMMAVWLCPLVSIVALGLSVACIVQIVRTRRGAVPSPSAAGSGMALAIAGTVLAATPLAVFGFVVHIVPLLPGMT
ncbi:hypothetical protein [Bifidobacterium saguinibicoloris]|uniref:hypothetical protein n=1 Tax=Bifidobacterium saguinibicoloris TaxID=2834433 RepID=UPI001C5A4AE3|nr:hypothetical protein [Bifidobacterium saguinibicoloris]MBW3080849.1 hypothetical protein [Bifidobacterium saguinibicoloris]